MARVTTGLSIILPFRLATPLPRALASAMASIMARALLRSFSLGINTLCSGSIWRGLMTDLPSKPSFLIRVASAMKPSSSLTLENTVSSAAMPAARAAFRIIQRAKSSSMPSLRVVFRSVT